MKKLILLCLFLFLTACGLPKGPEVVLARNNFRFGENFNCSSDSRALSAQPDRSLTVTSEQGEKVSVVYRFVVLRRSSYFFKIETGTGQGSGELIVRASGHKRVLISPNSQVVVRFFSGNKEEVKIMFLVRSGNVLNIKNIALKKK